MLERNHTRFCLGKKKYKGFHDVCSNTPLPTPKVEAWGDRWLKGISLSMEWRNWLKHEMMHVITRKLWQWCFKLKNLNYLFCVWSFFGVWVSTPQSHNQQAFHFILVKTHAQAQSLISCVENISYKIELPNPPHKWVVTHEIPHPGKSSSHMRFPKPLLQN